MIRKIIEMCYCVEIIKQIPNYNNYFITSKGRVFKQMKKSKREIFTRVKRDYLHTRLTQNKKRKEITIHSLVLKTFNRERINNEVIDHIDRNKLNNCICNLRYVSISDNNSNIYKKGCVSKPKGSNKYRFYYYIKKKHHYKWYDTYEEARTQQLIYQSLQKVFKINL